MPLNDLKSMLEIELDKIFLNISKNTRGEDLWFSCVTLGSIGVPSTYMYLLGFGTNNTSQRCINSTHSHSYLLVPMSDS